MCRIGTCVVFFLPTIPLTTRYAQIPKSFVSSCVCSSSSCPHFHVLRTNASQRTRQQSTLFRSQTRRAMLSIPHSSPNFGHLHSPASAPFGQCSIRITATTIRLLLLLTPPRILISVTSRTSRIATGLHSTVVLVWGRSRWWWWRLPALWHRLVAVVLLWLMLTVLGSCRLLVVVVLLVRRWREVLLMRRRRHGTILIRVVLIRGWLLLRLMDRGIWRWRLHTATVLLVSRRDWRTCSWIVGRLLRPITLLLERRRAMGCVALFAEARYWR